MTTFDTSKSNIYLLAFAKAILSLLTAPAKYHQRSISSCLIGQLEKNLPEGTNVNYPDSVSAGLGISNTQLQRIYDSSVGNHLKQNRSRARFAVVNAITIVAEGKPKTGIIGLLLLVKFLLTKRFKYNQNITGNRHDGSTGCLWFIFAGILDGTNVPKSFSAVYGQINTALSVSNSTVGQLYTSDSMPADLQKRYKNARQQRTKNFIGAVRILRHIANDE